MENGPDRFNKSNARFVESRPMNIFVLRLPAIPGWLFIIGLTIAVICSTALAFAGDIGEKLQDSVAADQWRRLDKASNIFQEIDLLEILGKDLNERPAVLDRLHKMWATYDVLRRPLIGYLMCQFGDLSAVESVSKEFFAGEYRRMRRELEPDGSAATSNATDAAYRVLLLYGTAEDRQRLVGFLKPADDPFQRGANLCEILPGLSSTKDGPGLPVGYPKERFPLEIAIACLDYTTRTATVVFAPGGSAESKVEPRAGNQQKGSVTVYGAVNSYIRRGCDDAAQAVQNITGLDFGHHDGDPIPQRDKAIESIKKWWIESHPGK